MPHVARTARLVAAAAALLLGAAAGPPALALEAEILAAGQTAPAFEAMDIDGRPFVLSEALEKGPVLLVFWSLFCGTCRDELPILEQEKPKYEGKVQIFTINLDEAPRAKSVQSFAKQQGFTFGMLLNKIEGKEFHIDVAYKVKATPALYLVNRDGKIAFGHYGALSPEELAEVVAKAQ